MYMHLKIGDIRANQRFILIKDNTAGNLYLICYLSVLNVS